MQVAPYFPKMDLSKITKIMPHSAGGWLDEHGYLGYSPTDKITVLSPEESRQLRIDQIVREVLGGTIAVQFARHFVPMLPILAKQIRPEVIRRWNLESASHQPR